MNLIFCMYDISCIHLRSLKNMFQYKYHSVLLNEANVQFCTVAFEHWLRVGLSFLSLLLFFFVVVLRALFITFAKRSNAAAAQELSR